MENLHSQATVLLDNEKDYRSTLPDPCSHRSPSNDSMMHNNNNHEKKQSVATAVM